MLAFLLQGGVVLLPIVVLSVIGVALIAERLVYTLRTREPEAELARIILERLRAGDSAGVLSDLREKRSPESRVLLVGLEARRRRRTAEEITLEMETAALREAEQLERNVPYLASIANLATLLGLLGTVTGMIVSFFNLKAAGVSDPALLAGGISQALITTAAGLTVAIPCLLCFHIFRQRANRVIGRLEIAISELRSVFAVRASSRKA